MEGLKVALGPLGARGYLRAGINTGNRAIVQQGADGSLDGLAPRLAHRLASFLAVPLVVVPYATARDMAGDAPKDLWDICFLGHDPGRAHLLAWSRPYLEIAAVFAGRAPLPLTDPAQADQPGTTILSAKGAAYDLHLARTIRHAALIRADSFTEAATRFRGGEGDLVAGVRESLARVFGGDPAFALMQTPFATVGQAIAVPLAQAELVAALDLWLQGLPAQ